MQEYIGTKIINAKPINRKDYNDLRGWKLPEDENGSDEGYLVEDTDGGNPNMKGVKGYVSWLPKDVFERSYHLTVDSLESALRAGQAPKVTSEDILTRIQDVTYICLGESTTLCSIYLDNGFSVQGEAACVSPENYDSEIGRTIAYNNAFDKLWPLFGFLLAENIHIQK